MDDWPQYYQHCLSRMQWLADRMLLKMKELDMRRHKMSSGKSKRLFSKSGSMTHKKNMPKRIPMRGGIRL